MFFVLDHCTVDILVANVLGFVFQCHKDTHLCGISLSVLLICFVKYPLFLPAGVYDEVCAMREACGDAHMKTILATGELGNFANIYKASMVCMMAGMSVNTLSSQSVDCRLLQTLSVCVCVCLSVCVSDGFLLTKFQANG